MCWCRSLSLPRAAFVIICGIDRTAANQSHLLFIYVTRTWGRESQSENVKRYHRSQDDASMCDVTILTCVWALILSLPFFAISNQLVGYDLQAHSRRHPEYSYARRCVQSVALRIQLRRLSSDFCRLFLVFSLSHHLMASNENCRRTAKLVSVYGGY